MRCLWKFIGFSVFVLFAPCVLAASPFSADDISLLKQHLLDNIATSQHQFTKQIDNQTMTSLPGAVMASPSNHSEHFSQDYQFHWTRDAAITMQEVLYFYAHASGIEKQTLRTYLFNYIAFEQQAEQQISNLGEQTLGQPKFNMDGTIWEGVWMRPQNDGAALRVIAMVKIANQLWAEGDYDDVHIIMPNLIITDLNYVAAEYQHPSYDLWEEVLDRDHFFTKMVQRRALLDGSALLERMHIYQEPTHYRYVASQLTQSIAQHWHPELGYYTETINQLNYKGGGLDTSIILGVLLGNIKDANDPFAITNDRIENSIYVIRHAFADNYQINRNHREHVPLLGRYPSDMYDGDQFAGGNPWVITSAALAQYYYAVANAYMQQQQIVIDAQNIAFFMQILGVNNMAPHTIDATTQPDEFNNVINHLVMAGDDILNNLKQYAVCNDNDCLHFAEQIQRDTGMQTSARDLTWGYAGLVRAWKERPALP